MLIKVGVHSKPFHYVSISERQQKVNSQITSVPFGRDYSDDPHHSTVLALPLRCVKQSNQITHMLLIEEVSITGNMYESNALHLPTQSI